MTLVDKLIAIQSALNVPKNQTNNFGKYNYRSCEDILEALKPLLASNGAVLLIEDAIEQVGDRFYVKATATITDGKDKFSASACAREELQKKGCDSAQLTGATSSYARKYALNGLFCIDDCKDADTNAYRQQAENKAKATISGFDADAYLSQIEPAIAATTDMAALKAVYTDGHAALAAFPEHKKKLIEMKDKQKLFIEAAQQEQN